MSAKIYKIRTLNLFSHFLWPVLVVIFLTWAFYISWGKVNYPIALKLFFYVFIISIFTVPVTLLILNHWKYFKDAELIISDEKFVYRTGNTQTEFMLKDIKSVTEYFTVSKLYGDFLYWQIELPDTQITFSNMLISASVFNRHFGKTKVRKMVVWPSVK
jgi:hypothetical protein